MPTFLLMIESSASSKARKVCIVVPCYNEEGVIGHTVDVLIRELERMNSLGLVSAGSYICCVDDGSRDGTWREILGLAERTGRVQGIKLSANFGHPNALVAGLFSNHHNADVLITIDADLQDDVSVLARMMEYHGQGKLVVYGVRVERKVDPLPKRIAAAMFYTMMSAMNGRTVRGHADFRSADARVVSDLERFGEVNLYLRGIFPLIGYPSAQVNYERLERHAGESKYSYVKLMSLAWQGITSFTTTPLRIVFYTGLVMFLIAGMISLWVIWAAFNGDPIQGWSSLALLLTTFSAINMISLGIMGEYIGKIYKEVKHRPRYIIETTTPDG
ncbi:MAG: glycosyltransferase family 2 protein [Flavobacteriales bacterium]|nr:glycosyltransferase family 2 protein [Flavobacteriales bacterium]